MKKYVGVLIGLFLFMGVLSACSGSNAEPTVPATVEEKIMVLMNDNWYGETNDNEDKPPVWEVTSGKLVELEMKNKGNVGHNWVLIQENAIVPYPFDASNEQHQKLIVFDSGAVGSKETKKVTFIAPEPGRYQIICTLIAHYPGMQGYLNVK